MNLPATVRNAPFPAARTAVRRRPVPPIRYDAPAARLPHTKNFQTKRHTIPEIKHFSTTFVKLHTQNPDPKRTIPTKSRTNKNHFTQPSIHPHTYDFQTAAPSARSRVRPAASAAPKSYTLSSPDGELQGSVTVGSDLRISLEADGRTVLAPSPVSMTLAGGERWDTIPGRPHPEALGGRDDRNPRSTPRRASATATTN